jgi:hypothetical protein
VNRDKFAFTSLRLVAFMKFFFGVNYFRKLPRSTGLTDSDRMTKILKLNVNNFGSSGPKLERIELQLRVN